MWWPSMRKPKLVDELHPELRGPIVRLIFSGPPKRGKRDKSDPPQPGVFLIALAHTVRQWLTDWLTDAPRQLLLKYMGKHDKVGTVSD